MPINLPPAARPRILIVEDEPSIRDTIQYPLESDGCETECCGTGGEALARLAAAAYDLVVLDVGLPDMTGFEICRRIRETGPVPVLFLTARSDEIDRVVGLEIGGDDYVTKPFSPRELSARIRAVLRRVRTAAPAAPAAEPGRFAIDADRCEIRYFSEALELSRYEFRLLRTLIARPGRVFSRAQLMDAAWEEPDASMERTVDAHIKSLRAKLHAVRPGEEPIRTHRGFGYSLAGSA
jgi:two-component system catabolic regulation response regulator CreB